MRVCIGARTQPFLTTARLHFDTSRNTSHFTSFNRFQLTSVKKDTSYLENFLTTTFHIVFARDKTQVKTLQREGMKTRLEYYWFLWVLRIAGFDSCAARSPIPIQNIGH